MTERRLHGDTSPQYRAVASGMSLSLDLSHKATSPLRSPPVHVGGTSSQPYSSPPPSGARLTPKPVVIDLPSPASFDPLLEHFLRAVEPSAGTCACLFERGKGGKVIRMVLEGGNILLMSAERGWGAYTILAADGTRIASLSRASKGSVLTALSLPAARAELAAYRLSECQLKHVPAKPTLNRMQLAISRLCPADEAAPTTVPVAKALGRAPGELAASRVSDTYVPGPPYRAYGLRVPASCVRHVPKAQGSLPRRGGALYVHRTRTSLGRAARTAYRVAWCSITTGGFHRCAAIDVALARGV